MITNSRLAALGLFDTRVPRYTSYPTAPQFNAAIGADSHRRWIAAIAPGSTVSLYVHIPFCRRLCWFCACRTQGTQKDAPVRAYLQTLQAELALLKQILPDGVQLGRLHWGGGTPTLLSPTMMQDLAGAITAVAPLAKGAEFSVEIDPNEIDAARLDTLAAAGMTRASIGVQDFDPQIQQTIGRVQSYEVTRDAVAMLRARGIRSLNADILYGLPHQSRGRIADSVQKLLSLHPDRVALYGYAHVPWMARRQAMIATDSLPDPQQRLDLFETARRLFVWDGYDEIGIDHFATPQDGLGRARRRGGLRRNFQGYTDDRSEVLIGLGASAISRFPQGSTQNAAATSAHTGRIRAGEFSTARGHAFAGDDALRARIIEALMCDFRVETDELTTRFGAPRAQIDQLFAHANRQFDGLLELSETGLAIPPDLRPLTRLIARSFDAYTLSPAGHSPAI